MSLLKTLHIGHSGIRAAQLGINATAHNVANVSTPGFTRRTAVTSTTDPLRRGRVWFGQGVSADGILRQSSHTLSSRLIGSKGLAQQSNTSWMTLRSLERIYDSSERTTSPTALSAFFDSLTAATADPADPSVRAAITSSARDLAGSINRDAVKITNLQEDQLANIDSLLQTANDHLLAVARLNEKIAASTSGSLAAGDLLDQREQRLHELADLVGVQVHFGNDDQVTVFIDGHAAVSGGEARTLSLDDSTTPPRVNLSHSSGKTISITNGLGGTVGGHLSTWRDLQGWRERLDTFATDFATALNAAHAGGFDQDGSPGGAIFTFDTADPATTLAVDAALLGNPRRWAFAGSTPASAGDIANLRALIDLETSAIVDGRTATSHLTGIVTSIGARVTELEQLTVTQQAMTRDLEEMRENLFGVDLDEEAANLMLYQAAYQASARVITASNQLVDTLLDMVR
jgi:flagellar hook-associated protein 1 FlgK